MLEIGLLGARGGLGEVAKPSRTVTASGVINTVFKLDLDLLFGLVSVYVPCDGPVCFT